MNNLNHALTQLIAAGESTVRYSVDTAAFTDEAAWDRLSSDSSAAVKRLTETYGSPDFSGTGSNSPLIGFRCPSANEIEKITYWDRGDTFLCVLLILQDNTRYRELVLGVCNRRDVRPRPQDPFWRMRAGDSYWDA